MAVSDDVLSMPPLDPMEVYKFNAKAHTDRNLRLRVRQEPRLLVMEIFGVDLGEGIVTEDIELLTSSQVSLLKEVNRAILRGDRFVITQLHIGKTGVFRPIPTFSTYVYQTTTEVTYQSTTLYTALEVEIGLALLVIVILCIGFLCLGPSTEI
jgi:hypothetical protein